jgi:alpha-L-fucosidase 2
MVAAPSLLPEQGDVCAGPTMDNHILRPLLEYTIEAANILNVDKDFVASGRTNKTTSSKPNMKTWTITGMAGRYR